MATRQPPKASSHDRILSLFSMVFRSRRSLPTRSLSIRWNRRCTHALYPLLFTSVSRLPLRPFTRAISLALAASLSPFLFAILPPQCSSGAERSWPRASSDRCRRKSRRSSWPPGECSVAPTLSFSFYLQRERARSRPYRHAVTARFF